MQNVIVLNFYVMKLIKTLLCVYLSVLVVNGQTAIPGSGCIQCFCHASSVCNKDINCFTLSSGVNLCGPLTINYNYGKDSNEINVKFSGNKDNTISHNVCLNCFCYVSRKCNRKVTCFTLTTGVKFCGPLIIGNELWTSAVSALSQGPNKQSVVQLPGPDNDCIFCICQASSSCNRDTACINSANGINVCGPLHISHEYWRESGKMVLDDDDPNREGAYEACVRNVRCASLTVRSYMMKFGQDCNGDGVINCMDFMLIHYLGRLTCTATIEDIGYNSRYGKCATEKKIMPSVPL